MKPVVGKARAQQSTRQRPGRRFEPSAELALFTTAQQAATQLPAAASGVLALTELHAPFGIPDLTVVLGTPGLRRSRLRLRVPPLLNEVDAGIVSVASELAISSVRQLAARLRWPVSTVDRRLSGLLRVGALREPVPEKYVRPASLQPIGDVVAIETKIDDWRRALVQCRTYRTWADSYVLIMHHVAGSSMENLVAEVRRDRGGLIVGEHWILHPKLHKLPRPRRLWTSEHIVAACKRTRSNPLTVRN